MKTMRFGFLFAMLFALMGACQPQPGMAITHTGLLAFDQPVDEIINGPMQEHHWVFAGIQGAGVSVLFRAEPNLPTLQIRTPDGEILREVRGRAYQNTIVLDNILPVSGNYGVVIQMQTEGQASYHLALREISAENNPQPSSTPLPPTSPAALLVPATTPVPLSTAIVATEESLPPEVGSGARLMPHQPVLGRIDEPGRQVRYTIVGKAGETITVGALSIAASPVDPMIRIYQPSGDLLLEADNTYGLPDAIITGLQLPVTGAYIVFVQDARGQSAGLFEIAYGHGLTMRRQVRPAPQPDTVVSGLLNEPATQDAWPLDLHIGDIISAAVVVDDNSGLDPVLSLVTQNGQVIYTDDNSGGGRNAALRQVIVPADGTFYLTVSPAVQDSYGPYTLFWRYDAQAPGN